MSNILVTALDYLRRCSGYRFPRVGPAYHILKHLLPKKVDTLLFPGIRLELDLEDETQLSTYWRGPRFERPTPKILASWGKAGAKTFFDIGANYGFFSYWMLWQCPNLAVYAFDPHPLNYQIMLTAKKRNALERFYPVALALGDERQMATLRHGLTDSGHSTLAPHPQLAATSRTMVTVVAFDDWCAERSLVAQAGEWVAKIDVEGYEKKVLLGMRKALAQKAFCGLVVEINPYTLSLMDTNPSEILHLLCDFGYRPLNIRIKRRDTMNMFFVPA